MMMMLMLLKCFTMSQSWVAYDEITAAFILEVMLYARGCLICSIANATSDRSATRVSILETRIIFLDPKVSVSSRKTNAEPAARRANQRRPIEKARISCEIMAAKRGTRLVGSAPCLVTCDGSAY